MQTLYLLQAQAQLLITGLLDSFRLLYVPVQSNSQCFGVFLGNQLQGETFSAVQGPWLWPTSKS